ncbi:hypothetical protein E4T56_gene4593 [Termitomyces sp. T112]|nr:hypothetical protein E4T56_gene4593 [Termitomyces sp. T112]
MFNTTFLPDPFTFADGTQVETLSPTGPAAVLKLPPYSQRTNWAANRPVHPSSAPRFPLPPQHSQSPPHSAHPPFLALIAFDGLSLPVPSTIATIALPVSSLAQQNSLSSRGIGDFYTLYGFSASAGALTAFTWGVSRVIDALELTPSVQIDTTQIGVTGCSRNGKGTLVAGALDSRVALTIPQESGFGGTDCWRLSDVLFAGGLVMQTALEIVQENVWFARSFEEFANTTVDRLPVNHHMLMGLVAPRGLLVIDNVGFDWLGPESSFGCVKTARRIWEAMGAGLGDRVGMSQAASHAHCVFPTEQTGVLNAFIERFLLGQAGVNTSVFESAGGYVFDMPGVWDPWDAPQLN